MAKAVQRSSVCPPPARSATDTIAGLRETVARNPGDLDSGLRLGSALYTAGDYKGSARALRASLRCHPDHTQTSLLLARAETRAGDVSEAINVLAHAQQADPDNRQIWQLAAALAAQVRDWPALRRIASDWTRAHPRSPEAWQALSHSHFEVSGFDEAMAAFEPVLALEPDSATHRVSAARLATAAQQYEAAYSHLAKARALAPDSGEVLYALSRLYQLTGELDLAEQYCRRAIAARPDFAPAYTALGLLREGRLDEAEIDTITRLTGDPDIHAEYRAMLGFTLAEALDRRSDYASAFAAWESANQINRRISEQEGIVYRREQQEQEAALLDALFPESAAADLAATTAGCESGDGPRPIFVVGMPRSGTTLIESILASHSEVEGAGELPTLTEIHEDLLTVAREQGVDAARATLRKQRGAWRQRYLATLVQRSRARHVVDKQPINYRSIGLIRVLFPESPIIYVQRSAVEVGFSIYRHNFSKNWPCAHQLSDIGHYYGVHSRIVTLWQERYPTATHIVDHAALVREPQVEITKLLKFAGLDIESGCFTPHKTKRSIATFSSVQVRRPISDTYCGRSAYYIDKLLPLRDALLEAGVDIGNEAQVASQTCQKGKIE